MKRSRVVLALLAAVASIAAAGGGGAETGTATYADRSPWAKRRKVFDNVTVVTGFLTAIRVFLTYVVELRVDCLAP